MNSIDYKTIGQTIHTYRIMQNTTQEELSEEAEISTSFLSKIEMGSKKPSLDTLVRIAVSLGVSIDDLIFSNSAIDNYEVTKRMILNLLNDCSLNEQKLIYSMINGLLRYLAENGIRL